MKELLTKWSELKKQPKQQGMPTLHSTRQPTLDKLEVLKALRAAGCIQIPGEAFDVEFLIKDFERVLREMP